MELKFRPVDRIENVRVLTIAVPAFNDLVALEKTLVSIIPFFISLPKNEVELIVSDNASTDSTWEKASYLLKDIKNARVIRQSENIGFARNLKALSIESSAQFIWFVGLGERLAQNVLPELIEFLRRNDPDWGTLKGYFDFQQFVPSVDRGFLVGRSTVRNDVPVVSHVISLNIFRTELVRKLELGPGSVTDDFWPHFEVVAQYLLSDINREPLWFYFDTTTVLIAKNKHGAWDFKPHALDIFLEWGNVFWKISDKLENSTWMTRRSKELISRHFLEFIFMLTKFGTLRRLHVLQKIFSAPQIRWHFKLLSALISLAPRGLLTLLAHVRSMLRGDKSWRATKS